MSLTVVTGWSPAGWLEYGRRFLETFDRLWNPDVALIVYGEPDVSDLMLEHLLGKKPLTARKISFVDLREIPGCWEFLDRHKANLPARGLEKLPRHHWKERAIASGYNWRFDAWKFCRQGFIPLNAAERCGTDFLCWLDGDVVTNFPVRSASVITGLLPADKHIAYLGREPKHPDIAFQLYDIRRKPDQLDRVDMPWGYVWQMLQNFAALYRTDEVFQLGEWHSAYVWKEAVARANAWPVVHNLTPGGSGHVWHQSPLKGWGDHLKGDRKKRGRSLEARR